MNTHTCPARGCPRQVSDDMLACRQHWYDLPKPLRDALWRAYNDHGRGSPAHTAAVDACLRWYEKTGPGSTDDVPYHLQPQRMTYLRDRLTDIANHGPSATPLGPADAADVLRLLEWLTARARHA